MPKDKEMAEECILDGFQKLPMVRADQLDRSQCCFDCIVFFLILMSSPQGHWDDINMSLAVAVHVLPPL